LALRAWISQSDLPIFHSAFVYLLCRQKVSIRVRGESLSINYLFRSHWTILVTSKETFLLLGVLQTT